MSAFVLTTILLAAFLHAMWNTIAKKNKKKRQAILAVVLGHVPFALVAIPFANIPALESLPYILVGALLHIGYQLSLSSAYQHGDLSTVYPISRGAAPVLAAIVLFFFWNESLTYKQLIAISAICIGVFSFAFVGNQNGKISENGIRFSLLTATFIAGYSVIDGMGARIAETALGFYICLTILNAAFMLGINMFHEPIPLKQIIIKQRLAFWLGGGASFLAYALVTWSFTQAPIALVAAIRETSIIIALFFGTFFLNEKIHLKQVLSTIITVSGVIFLKLSK